MNFLNRNCCLISLLLFCIVFSCKEKREKNYGVDESSVSNSQDYSRIELNENFNENNNQYLEDALSYEDGTYCAEIDYYNPNTGTSNTYTLNVEIEDDELVMIYWPNGGWLDESHFYAEDVSDGYCSITSDRGYEYTIEILGNDCIADNYIEEEDEDNEEENFYNDEYENSSEEEEF